MIELVDMMLTGIPAVVWIGIFIFAGFVVLVAASSKEAMNLAILVFATMRFSLHICWLVLRQLSSL